MNTLQNPNFSRRDLLRGAVLLAASAAIGGCSSSETVPTTTQLQVDEASLSFIKGSRHFAVRSADVNKDPLFRAASGALYSVDQKNTMYAGSFFPFKDEQNKTRFGSVEHAVSQLKDRKAVACLLAGVLELTQVPPVTYTRSNASVDDGLVVVEFDQQVTTAIEAGYAQQTIAELRLARRAPNVGESFTFANTRTGMFEELIYGSSTDVLGVQRPTYYAKTAVEILGDIPKSQQQHDAFVAKITGVVTTGVEQYLNRYVCDGDSGSPLLTASGEVIGTLQGIGLNLPNEIGQLCSPIVMAE